MLRMYRDIWYVNGLAYLYPLNIKYRVCVNTEEASTLKWLSQEAIKEGSVSLEG